MANVNVVNWRIIEPVGAHSSGLTISSATVLTRPAGAEKLIIQTVAQNVRFTLDGSTPTAAVGFRIIADDPPMEINVGSTAVVTVIQEASSPAAVLQYQWSR